MMDAPGFALNTGKCKNLRTVRQNPDVSIIVVSFNNSDLTRDCLRRIWAHTHDRHYEIIVVDNGSSTAEFEKLASFPGEFHLIRLRVNRFVGEGNNIGVEASRGRYVVFLNNDAFVTDNWLKPLIDILENQSDAGGVGPKFLYPDGRLQEAGAVLNERGITIQRGKLYKIESAALDSVGIVDYCTAACFAIPRAIFDRISGFDPAFEPGYYEDTDLCFRITSLGLSIYYCPYSVVHHIENATTSAFWHGFDDIKEINRKKFLSRWGDYLSARSGTGGAPLPPLVPLPPFPSIRARVVHRPRARGPIAVFHTPYDLTPDAAGRYLLTAASALATSHRVHVVTDAPYSHYRLDHLARYLSLDLSRTSFITRSELQGLGAIDVFCHIGDHVYPIVPAMGHRNFYMCRFPFCASSENLTHSWENLRDYDRVLVDSRFALDALRAKINAFQFKKELEVLAPPVPIHPPLIDPSLQGSDSLAHAAQRSGEHAGADFEDISGRTIILSVGDFSRQDHRHDVLIEGIKRLAETGIDAELHLVDASHSYLKDTLHPDTERNRRYDQLRQQANGMPVRMHPDTSGLRDLLYQATIYWHATGFACDPKLNPENCEHFGVSILEAMGVGCVPFVVSNGGPTEFVRDGDTGFQYGTLEELIIKTCDLLRDRARAVAVSERARQEARKFAAPVFMDKWCRIAGRQIRGALHSLR
jgi:O-antigen biosynthesis protein